MPGSWDIAIGFVCPLIGVILSNVTILSPVPALLEARKNKELGNLDPIPFALFVNSKLGWLIFSIFRTDYFIFFSAAPATLMGIVLCFTSIHLLERNDHEPVEETLRLVVEGLLFGSGTYWIIIVFITTFFVKRDDVKTQLDIIGYCANVATVTYYGAPVLKMQQVIKYKDSSVFHGPTIVINLVNCILWFLYGLGTSTIPIMLNNLAGGMLCILELGLIFKYPRHATATATATTTTTPATAGRATADDKYPLDLTRKQLTDHKINHTSINPMLGTVADDPSHLDIEIGTEAILGDEVRQENNHVPFWGSEHAQNAVEIINKDASSLPSLPPLSSSSSSTFTGAGASATTSGKAEGRVDGRGRAVTDTSTFLWSLFGGVSQEGVSTAALRGVNIDRGSISRGSSGDSGAGGRRRSRVQSADTASTSEIGRAHV